VDWVFVVLVGALIGWLASIVASSESQQGVTSNIIIGIAGAFVGRWLFSSVLHLGSASAEGSLSLFGIVWGVFGALIVIFLLRSLRFIR
jgi:uncharacterized membrane protein YeaQ/YmgE (transglycosylase-associated protein family)